MKKRLVVIALLLIISLIVPYVNAGFFDFFKKLQKSPSQQTDITIQVGNVAPIILNVQSIPTVNLLQGTTKDVIFNFTARDNNGVSDLNDASALAKFNKTGEPLRTGSCILVETVGSNKKYQCTVQMQYFDDNEEWSINVSIKDIAGLSGEDSTTSFTVALLKDISINPITTNFPVVDPGGTNIISSQDTEITNNGNFDAPLDGTLSVTSYNLTGLTNPSEFIPAINFNISGLSGKSTVCATGTNLSDETSVSIAGISLARGAVGNTENLTYCLTSVPIISSQSYSTTGIGSQPWVIGI